LRAGPLNGQIFAILSEEGGGKMQKSTFQLLSENVRFRGAIRAYRKAKEPAGPTGGLDKAQALAKAVALHEGLAGKHEGSVSIRLAAGRLLLGEGKPKKAAAVFEDALGAAEPGSIDEANALISLAAAYRRAGHHSSAKSAFSRAFSIVGASRPAFSAWAKSAGPFVADACEYLLECRRSKAAASLGKKALPYARGVLRAELLSCVAIAESEMGGESQARKLHQRALAESKGARARQRAKICLAAALFRKETGEGAKALPLFEEALRCQEESLGPGHSDLIPALESIAAIKSEMDDGEGARAALARAIEISVRRFGAESEKTASLFVQLAWMLREKEGYKSASQLYERAAEIYAQLKGQKRKAAEAARGCARCAFAIGNDSQALYWSRIAEAMEREGTQ
jgi:tetratricopeptide (TPR) repeat protein